MIPQSSLCSGGDDHGVTEEEKKGNREKDATTVKEKICSGLEAS